MVNRRSNEEFKKVGSSGALTAASLSSEFEAKEELVKRREVKETRREEEGLCERVDRWRKKWLGAARAAVRRICC